MAVKNPQASDKAANALTSTNVDTAVASSSRPSVVVHNGGEEPKTFDKVIDEGSQPANIAGATEFAPSGAPVQIVGDVDPSHPSVDDNPRAGTTVNQNKIDFNDPTKSGQEVVSEQLGMTKPSDAA